MDGKHFPGKVNKYNTSTPELYLMCPLFDVYKASTEAEYTTEPFVSTTVEAWKPRKERTTILVDS